MQADIRIGEVNICVYCGKLKITYQKDEDGLPICEECIKQIEGTEKDGKESR